MVRFLSVAVCLLAIPTSANATGLLWNLPEDGRSVSYQGTYTKQTTDGNPEITWLRNMSIKSVGTVDAEYKGVSQPCRWVEIEVVTGKKGETGLDPGPAGGLLYKVLIPESKIVGDTKDVDDIPVSMIPIVKGYRRIGEGAVKPIKAKALQV